MEDGQCQRCSAERRGARDPSPLGDTPRGPAHLRLVLQCACASPSFTAPGTEPRLCASHQHDLNLLLLEVGAGAVELEHGVLLSAAARDMTCSVRGASAGTSVAGADDILFVGSRRDTHGQCLRLARRGLPDNIPPAATARHFEPLTATDSEHRRASDGFAAEPRGDEPECASWCRMPSWSWPASV